MISSQEKILSQGRSSSSQEGADTVIVEASSVYGHIAEIRGETEASRGNVFVNEAHETEGEKIMTLPMGATDENEDHVAEAACQNVEAKV